MKLNKQEKLAVKLYSSKPATEVAQITDVPWKKIRQIARVLKLKRENHYWTKKEDDFLIKHYPIHTYNKLVTMMNKTHNAIVARVVILKREGLL